MKEGGRALEELGNIIYKGRIDTYLLLRENLNIKARLTRIAWRVKVESKLLQDILRWVSHFKFHDDDHWKETLQEVGRQEEELLKHGKLSKSRSTPHCPAAKPKWHGSEKGFNTKFVKKNENQSWKEKTSRWKSPWTTTAKPTKNSSRDEHINWKKPHEGIAEDVVEKPKKQKQCTPCTLGNHTWRQGRELIVVATTFPYKDWGNSKTHQKSRTSRLAIHNPPLSCSEQFNKVDLVYRELPTQVWEFYDTEMA